MAKHITDELVKQQTEAIITDSNKVIMELMTSWKRYMDKDVQRHIDTINKREMGKEERDEAMQQVKKAIERSKKDLLTVAAGLFTGNIDYM